MARRPRPILTKGRQASLSLKKAKGRASLGLLTGKVKQKITTGTEERSEPPKALKGLRAPPLPNLGTGRAKRNGALYNKGEEVDPTPSQFPILPNNFNPDLPPKRRKTKPEREEAGPAPKQGEEGSSYSYYSESEGAEEPSSSAARDPPYALRKGQEQDCPLLSLPRKGSRRKSSKTMRRNPRNSWRFNLTPQWKSSR